MLQCPGELLVCLEVEMPFNFDLWSTNMAYLLILTIEECQHTDIEVPRHLPMSVPDVARIVPNPRAHLIGERRLIYRRSLRVRHHRTDDILAQIRLANLLQMSTIAASLRRASNFRKLSVMGRWLTLK